jgi:hypothetical protein
MPHAGAASLGRRCLGHHLLALPDLSERKRETEKKRGEGREENERKKGMVRKNKENRK